MSFIKARNALVKEIASREGLRSQVKVGDLREVIRILIDMEVEARMLKTDGPINIVSEEAWNRFDKLNKKSRK